MTKKNPRSGKQKRKEKMKEREKYWNKVIKEKAKKEKAKKEKETTEGAEEEEGGT